MLTSDVIEEHPLGLALDHVQVLLELNKVIFSGLIVPLQELDQIELLVVQVDVGAELDGFDSVACLHEGLEHHVGEEGLAHTWRAHEEQPSPTLEIIFPVLDKGFNGTERFGLAAGSTNEVVQGHVLKGCEGSVHSSSPKNTRGCLHSLQRYLCLLSTTPSFLTVSDRPQVGQGGFGARTLRRIL